MLKNPDEILQIDNLAVIAFELGDNPTREIKDWYASLQRWRDASEIPMAESCARQVWYGRACDFENFPHSEVPVMRGGPAYAYLLKVFSEVDNDKEWVFNENNIGNYRILRESYAEAHPENMRVFEKFHRFFMADSGLLRGQVLSKLKPRAWKDVIRNLSGQEAGDTALLIGSLNRHGQLSESTMDAVLAMRRSRHHKVGSIMVTHPDPAISTDVIKGIRAIRPSLMEYLRIERVNFEDFSLCAEICDLVLVDLPIDQYPDADSFIISSWNERERTDNVLTHIRGKPQLGNRSTPLWQAFSDANPDSVRLHEDLDIKSYELESYNGQVIEHAKDSFAIAAGLRLNGIRPNSDLLKKTPPPFVTPTGPAAGILSCG